jgi:hypothetical protein
MTIRAITGRTWLALLLGLLIVALASAQDSAEADGRDAAPIDLEGNWISLVTEDWRWRMLTPAKGDYTSVPLNDAGIRATNMWNPDEARTSCRPYGAANVMRMPTRLRIGWTDANTLRIETDHGMQTRNLHFLPQSTPAARSRQGHSVASWDGSALKVTTTNLLPGYLRINGVPYSESAVVTEYYNTHSAFGDEGFTVTTIVHDPVYLEQDFVTSTTFLRLEDSSEWNPTPCQE